MKIRAVLTIFAFVGTFAGRAFSVDLTPAPATSINKSNSFGATVAPSDEIVARVNGSEITRKDLDTAVKAYNSQMSKQGHAPSEQTTAQQHVLDEMIGRQLILQQAQGQGPVDIDKQVQEEVDRTRKMTGGEGQFKKTLADMDLTPEQYTQKVRDNIIIRRAIKSLVDKQDGISVEDARAFYEANPDQFQQVTGGKAATRPFDEVKDKLVDYLKLRKDSELTQAYVADLRNSAKVEVFLPAPASALSRPSAETPPVTATNVKAENYTVAMKDGTVFVGAIQIKKVKFDGNYGVAEVDLNDVVNFSDGLLALSDGTKLKGSFSDGNLGLETARGAIILPFASITSITKPSGVVVAAGGTTQPSSPAIVSAGNGANLVGKVFDCFGKPLQGVSVVVQNTRFATTTDAQGSYSLGYVPGKIQVSYNRRGYYDASLTFEIATPSQYPVQDVSLYKMLPAKGIFLIGDDDYVKSMGSVQKRSQQGRNTVTMAAECQYYVAGQAVVLENPARDLRFVIDAPVMSRLGTPIQVAVFRVQPGGIFLRQTTNALMDNRNYSEKLNIGSISEVADLRIWTGHFDPGLYILTMAVDSLSGGEFFDPCFFFRIN